MCHNSSKTLNTNISLTHFIFCKTYQFLASQEIKNYFWNHIPKEWIQRFLLKIFLSNLQQISTLNQDMFNCDNSTTCNANMSKQRQKERMKKKKWIMVCSLLRCQLLILATTHYTVDFQSAKRKCGINGGWERWDGVYGVTTLSLHPAQ